MKKTILYLLLVLVSIVTMSCSENYSNGDRVGFMTKFSNKGYWSNCKSWEGELNLTQTGMNTSSLFEFSLDNDQQNQNEKLIKTLDSATVNGWKIKVKYHQVYGLKNFLSNRGETDYFVTDVEVLDRNMVNNIKDITNQNSKKSGSVRDTIYVIVIDPKDVAKYLKNK